MIKLLKITSRNCILIIFCTMFAQTTQATVNITDESLVCSEHPSCLSLGFHKNTATCQGLSTIRCPYDTSYMFCLNDPCTGYGLTATSGNYTCKDGQYADKCSSNLTKYRCNGIACEYNYSTTTSFYCGKAKCSTYQASNPACRECIDNKSGTYDMNKDHYSFRACSCYNDGVPYLRAQIYGTQIQKDKCGDGLYNCDFSSGEDIRELLNGILDEEETCDDDYNCYKTYKNIDEYCTVIYERYGYTW